MSFMSQQEDERGTEETGYKLTRYNFRLTRNKLNKKNIKYLKGGSLLTPTLPREALNEPNSSLNQSLNIKVNMCNF